jgi:hypothetical protein
MGRKPRRTRISARHWISNPPPEIEARTSFGHWECDLLIFAARSGKVNVTTLVERQSRFTMLLANDSWHSLPMIGHIRQALETWPSSARQSITFDGEPSSCGTKALSAPWRRAASSVIRTAHGRRAAWRTQMGGSGAIFQAQPPSRISHPIGLRSSSPA